MSTYDEIRDAANIQEAVLALAAALDRIEAGVSQPVVEQRAADGGWEVWEPPPPALIPDEWAPDEHGIMVKVDEDATEIELPTVSLKRQGERYAFAIDTLKIDAYAKSETTWDDQPENYESWAHVYAHGGPAWLYNANRDFVMSLPYETRAKLVDDLIQDDPAAAHEMSRDILKRDAETSPGHGVGPDPNF